MGIFTSKNEEKDCVYHSYGICKYSDRCQYNHNFNIPNKIPVFYEKNNLSRTTYTANFYHFGVKQSGQFIYITTLDSYGKGREKDIIFKVSDQDGKLIEYNYYKILANKKFVFYNLSRKYMVIKQINLLDDLKTIILLLMQFNQELITTI